MVHDPGGGGFTATVSVVGSFDPWQVLGIEAGAAVSEARSARRRLAKALHPDLHAGLSADEAAALAARMTMVNAAVDQIETAVVAAAAAGPTESPGAADFDADPEVALGVGDDSFSLERLPAEAFEALFVAAYGLGDILVADEPYLLELYLNEPACFCRLNLAPEAGGSLVTVEVSGATDTISAPHPAAVIALLTAELHNLLAF